jgi:cobalt-zinc-cadmium efflux system outer membrane protein
LLSATAATAGPGQPVSALPASAAPGDGSSANQVVQVAWADILRLVDAQPRLAAGRLQVDAARGGVDAAGAVPNPTVEGNVGRGLARTGGASRGEWGLALTVPLGWLAQRGARVAAAEAEVEVAEAEGEALRRDVLLQLQTLFWSVAHEQARVASLEELEAETRALTSTVQKRVEKGEVRPVESTRAEIELEKVASEVEAARTSLASRQAQLALWLGLTEGKTVVAVAELSALPAAIGLDTALARLHATHPALVAARARVRSLEADVETEKVARVPAVSLTGFTNDELDRRAYGVGLEVDLPLWNWNSGRIARAAARAAAGRMQAEAAARDLEAAVIEAEAACRASVQTANRLGTQVVPRAEAAASIMEKTYRLGEVGQLELIDSRRTLLDARRLRLSALSQAQIDCNRLGALVGEESR